MRLILAFALVFGFSAAASAQSALDWRDGGEIVMPTADLDGDAFPVGTTVRCVIDAGNGQIIVNSTVGTTVPIAASSIPKSATSPSTANASCTTPLNTTEAGAVATNSVLLRPWRGSGRSTLLP